MGCISDPQHNEDHKYFFKLQNQIKHRSDIFKPFYSQLFNALRRPMDIAILQPQLLHQKQKQPYLSNTLIIDFQQENPINIKTLLNFKKIVVIGEYERLKDSVLSFIQQKTNPSKIYLIDNDSLDLFLAEYPIFGRTVWERNQFKSKQIPIQLFDSDDIEEQFQPTDRVRIYSHPLGKEQPQIYEDISIQKSGIIREPLQGIEHQKYYLEQLLASSNHNILIQHNPQKMTQTTLAEMLADYVHKKWKKCKREQAQIYFSKNLPRASTANITMKPEVSNTKKTKDPHNLSPSQKFAKLFRKLEKQSSVEKTERAHDILNKLVTNIYSNPDTESFRQIKSSNKAIVQVLTSYESGRNLLEETGFYDEGAHWVNKMQIKYLKLFKTDLQLGFKQYKAGQEN